MATGNAQNLSFRAPQTVMSSALGIRKIGGRISPTSFCVCAVLLIRNWSHSCQTSGAIVTRAVITMTVTPSDQDSSLTSRRTRYQIGPRQGVTVVSATTDQAPGAR